MDCPPAWSDPRESTDRVDHSCIAWRPDGTGWLGQGRPLTNRIQVSDLAHLIHRALDQGEPGATYLGADERPATQREVVDHIIATYGLPAPNAMSLAEARVRLNKNVLAMITGSKRLDSTWTRQTLGLRLKRPTFVEGLAEIWRREEPAIRALVGGV